MDITTLDAIFTLVFVCQCFKSVSVEIDKDASRTIKFLGKPQCELLSRGIYISQKIANDTDLSKENFDDVVKKVLEELGITQMTACYRLISSCNLFTELFIKLDPMGLDSERILGDYFKGFLDSLSLVRDMYKEIDILIDSN
jgi:transcriptional regulator of met regulon